ncbi:MAG: hypothetical protein WC763_00705 [Candidatus Paceibacterota bacterium]|jgi:hypothetical protein
MAKPKTVTPKYGSWTKTMAEDTWLYTLPAGVSTICELREESRGCDPILFIGTNQGVYYTEVPRTSSQRREATPAHGLEEFSIDELKLQGEDIIAHATTGDTFIARSYILRGER